jgi:hypothetical protein
MTNSENQNGRAAIRNLIFSGTVDIFLLFKFVSRLPSVRLACRKRLSGCPADWVGPSREPGPLGETLSFSFYFRLRSVPETRDGPRSLIAERERTRGGKEHAHVPRDVGELYSCECGEVKEGSKFLSKGGQPLPTASLQPLPMPMLKPEPHLACLLS